MAAISISKFGENLPVTSLAAASQAVAGFGIGLVVASCLEKPVREKLGIGLAVAGLAALLPTVIGVAARLGNRPHSSRRMRKRLEGIRHDTGLSGNGDQF